MGHGHNHSLGPETVPGEIIGNHSQIHNLNRSHEPEIVEEGDVVKEPGVELGMEWGTEPNIEMETEITPVPSQISYPVTESDKDGEETIPELTPEQSLSPLGFSSNANFEQHRKLNQFIRLRQVGTLKPLDITTTAPSRTFSLLEISRRVVRSAIPEEFVSSVFISNAMELFMVLHRGQDFRYAEDIELRDYKWIEEILLKCSLGVGAKHKLNLRGNQFLPGCGHDGLVQSICLNIDDSATVSICERTTGGRHHQIGKYHYVIDAVWNIIDMTHVLCQPYFQASYRMFHVWEQASEKLFTKDIRELWYKPDVDLRVYDAILSSKAIMNMINLERATEGAYRLSQVPRLRRPSRVKNIFRR